MYRSLVALAKLSPRTLALVATLPAILAFATDAAQGQELGDDTAAAKAHYETGVRHFDLSEFDRALAEFKEAYRAKPDPVFLYNIGQCHRKLGHSDDAITFYQTYLRRAPDAKNREEVERRIAELSSLREAEKAAITNSTAGVSQQSQTSSGEQEKVAGHAAETASTPAALEFGVRDEAASRPGASVYKRWWFWTAIGAVAAGAATVAIIMAERDPTKIPSTTLGSQGALP